MDPEEPGEPPSKPRRSRRSRRQPKRFLEDVDVKRESREKKSTRRSRSHSRRSADDDDFLDDSDGAAGRRRPKRKRRRKKPPPPEVDPTHFLGYFADETSIEEIEKRFAALEAFRKKKEQEAVGVEKAKAEARVIRKLNVKGEGPEGPEVITDGSSSQDDEDLGQLSQSDMVEFYNQYGGRDERTHKDIVFEYELNQINEDEGEMDPEDHLFENLHEEEDRIQEQQDTHDMLEYDKAIQAIGDEEDERLGGSERKRSGRRGWRRRGHKGKLPRDMKERRLRFKDPFFNPRVPGIGYSRPSLPKFSPRIRKLHDAPMSILIKKGRPYFPGPTRRRTVIDFNKWWALLSQGLGTQTVCEEKAPDGFPNLRVERYLGECPDTARYEHNWYFHPKVANFDFKAIFKLGLQLVYCTPPWKSKKFTVDDFAELPWDNSPESAFRGGYLFIWIPNDIFQDVWKVLRYKFGFYYCESLTWIKIGPDMLQYGFDADPFSNTHGGQHGVAGEVLYLVRKNVHVKRDDCMRDVNPGVFIDATVPPELPDVSVQASIYRHQRMPDCFFDSTVPFDHPHWYVFRLMNDLLPSLFKPDRCAWIWPDPMCVFTSIEQIDYIEKHFIMIAQNNTFPEQADPTDLNAFLDEKNRIALSLRDKTEDGDDAKPGEEEMASAGDDDD